MDDKSLKPLTIVKYDSNWPLLFNQEKELILQTFQSEKVLVEHIGSTAIHGLSAKPTIDILIGIETLSIAADLIPLLGRLGYVYVPEFEADLPERRYFYKNRIIEDGVHIHMVEVGSRFWNRHIAFRNYLRVNKDAAFEYEDLKIHLANKYKFDRDCYTDAKTEFITRIETIALAGL